MFAVNAVNYDYYCSLPLWRVHEIKRMYLAPRTHGLFITKTQFRLLTTFRHSGNYYIHVYRWTT
jgi:hypothetical protein